MLFSSITFIFLFLPLVVLFYYVSPKKIRNLILLIFSLAFYAWGEPKYIIVMVASILIGYITGLLIEKFAEKENMEMSRLFMIISVVLNLGILAFFKYSGFFATNYNNIMKLFTDKEMYMMKVLDIALPLGISFYTFQILSYTVDVYRKEVKAQKNIINLACYITLFPQLIAGPIVRYQTVCEQLDERKESVDKFAEGINKFVVGLGKKVLIANQVGAIVDSIQVLPNEKMSVLLSWIAALAFSLQIYFDFSGYSDMAIGLGKMFGFDFLINFDYPYTSKSITEFWRRWHISLSSWFRDYVYIPLGGNRKGKARTFVNIFIVWILTGFWHGASWNFIIWGLYYFVLLVIEKIGFGKILDKLPSVVSRIYTLFFVNLGWVIFAYDDFGKMKTALMQMFFMGGIPFVNNMGIFYLLSYGIILIIAIIGATKLPYNLANKLIDKVSEKDALVSVINVVFIALVMVLAIASLASDSFNPFLYFRF